MATNKLVFYDINFTSNAGWLTYSSWQDQDTGRSLFLVGGSCVSNPGSHSLPSKKQSISSVTQLHFAAAQTAALMAGIRHVHSLNTGQNSDRSDQLFSQFTANPPRTTQPLPSISLPLHYSLTISLQVAMQADMMVSLLHKMYQTNSSQITAVSTDYTD
jgi:hypothetical protein